MKQGIKTVEELMVSGLLNPHQMVGAKHYTDLQIRIPRAEVKQIAEAVRRAVDAVLTSEGIPPEKLQSVAEATPCGSYRRGTASSGDVDVLLCRRDRGSDPSLLRRVLSLLAEGGTEVEHLCNPTGDVESYRGIVRLQGYPTFRRLDLKVYPRQEYAYALLYFTGSDHFNRSMRALAKAKGYSLSDHGLVRAQKVASQNIVRGTTNLAPAECERDIFAHLGLEYREPWDRNCDVKEAPGVALGGVTATTQLTHEHGSSAMELGS